MPYGLFDFEDTIQPMGLSPAYEPQWDSEAFYNVQNKIQNSILDKRPAPTPQNTGMVTRAIPETPPSPTNPLVPSFGFGNDMLENPFTTAMIGNEASPNMTLACIPSEGCNPNPVTARIPENSATPNPIMTMAIPESGVTPTPPSGQCPTGYVKEGTVINNVQIGAGGGTKGTPNTFGFDGQGNPIPVEGGAFNYAGNKQYQVGSGLGVSASKSSGSVFGSSGRTNEMPVRTPVSATAPSTWSGSQQQYTSMLNQLGLNTAR